MEGVSGLEFGLVWFGLFGVGATCGSAQGVSPGIAQDAIQGHSCPVCGNQES